jgi:hypothetical protein
VGRRRAVGAVPVVVETGPVARTDAVRLTGVFVVDCRRLSRMNEEFLDMETVTVELDAETLEELDDLAFAEHRENRDAAIRDLIDEWLKTRDE